MPSEVHLEAISQQLPQLDHSAPHRPAARAGTSGRQPGAEGGPSTKGPSVAALAEELRTGIDAVYRALSTTTERVGRDLGQIHDRVGEFRLLPARTIQASLERSVRDVADSLKKRVVFEMVGADQRLDAHVLFALRDALIHAVRNAVAHGIETEAERIAAGKPPPAACVSASSAAGSAFPSASKMMDAASTSRRSAPRRLPADWPRRPPRARWVWRKWPSSCSTAA